MELDEGNDDEGVEEQGKVEKGVREGDETDEIGKEGVDVEDKKRGVCLKKEMEEEDESLPGGINVLDNIDACFSSMALLFNNTVFLLNCGNDTGKSFQIPTFFSTPYREEGEKREEKGFSKTALMGRV